LTPSIPGHSKGTLEAPSENYRLFFNTILPLKKIDGKTEIAIFGDLFLKYEEKTIYTLPSFARFLDHQNQSHPNPHPHCLPPDQVISLL
jgi:hypothetical protein